MTEPLRPSCADLDAKEADDLFFTRTYQQMAKAMCKRCPVAAACLAMALEAEGAVYAGERFGVYGGTIPAERARAAHR